MKKSKEVSLADEVRAGSRRALAKAITLFEDTRATEREAAQDLLAELVPFSGKALRIGVSGPPGVGKSTFIEAFGKLLLEAGHSLAVLAIDPTSPLSGGSILGDRVRMETLSSHDKAFIRPSPSGLTLGGVARHTREAIVACEAAGYDRILVETVGVGQSETVVHSMVDVFLMLTMPHAGDEIQGIKRGILELADVVCVTKGDGELVKDAQRTKLELEQALGLARASTGTVPRVLIVSSTEGKGLKEVAEELARFVEGQRKTGAFEARRGGQNEAWFQQEVKDQLVARLDAHTGAAKLRTKLGKEVTSGKKSPAEAAAQVVDSFLEDP